ncbi:MAG: hypothetical protein HYS06_05595 [Methylocystis sp.]|nr:hypothetical protein [Methylocystis sp.]
MTTRSYVTLGAIVALFLGGAALAGQAPRAGGAAIGGTTSGPAAGTHVKPSTAVQKEGRSVAGGKEMQNIPDASSLAAGSPGIEGKVGAQSGQVPQGRAAPKKK